MALNHFQFVSTIVLGLILCAAAAFADDASDKHEFQNWDAGKETSKRLAEIIKTIGGNAKFRDSSHARDVPDLFRPDPECTGRFIAREQTVTIEDAFNNHGAKHEYITFRCAPHDNLFYVYHQGNSRNPTDKRAFGPFAGNPLEIFPELERHMLRDVISGDTNPLTVMRRIVGVGHSEWNHRALKFVDKVLLLPLDFQEKLGLIRIAEEMLSNNNTQFEDLAESNNDVAQVLASIDKTLHSLREKTNDMTLEFPEEDYTTAKEIPNVVPDKIEESLWGKPVNGLRFAVVPETKRLEFGKLVLVKLIVENVHNKDTIKFCVHDVIQDVRPQVTFDGKRVDTQGTWFSGWPPTSRYLLKPGDRMTLASSKIWAYSESAHPKDEKLKEFGVTGIPVSERILADDLAMQVDYTMSIGQGEAWVRCEDDVMRIYSPAKGEWKGRLDAGGFEIKFLRKSTD